MHELDEFLAHKNATCDIYFLPKEETSKLCGVNKKSVVRRVHDNEKPSIVTYLASIEKMRNLIPVPEIYHHDDKTIVMEKIPGKNMAIVDVREHISSFYLSKIRDEVQKIYETISIPHDKIGIIPGGAKDHHLTQYSTKDEYSSINDFLCDRIAVIIKRCKLNNVTSHNIIKLDALKEKIVADNFEPSEIVFCHNDLTSRNIMIKDFKITGIVDWEIAGYFPLYYEYCKYIVHGENMIYHLQHNCDMFDIEMILHTLGNNPTNNTFLKVQVYFDNLLI